MKKILLSLSFVGSFLLYIGIVGDAGKKYHTLDRLGMIVSGVWMAVFIYAQYRRRKK